MNIDSSRSKDQTSKVGEVTEIVNDNTLNSKILSITETKELEDKNNINVKNGSYANKKSPLFNFEWM